MLDIFKVGVLLFCFVFLKKTCHLGFFVPHICMKLTKNVYMSIGKIPCNSFFAWISVGVQKLSNIH